MAKVNAARTACNSPMAPPSISARARACWGWKRYMNASISRTPCCAQSATSAAASAASTVRGFSHRIGFPALAARRVHSACMLLGSGL